jgi:hypothetical protein
MAATDMNKTIEEILEAMFSVQSVSRLYNEEQLRLQGSLETALRVVGVSCETVASQQGREHESEEAKEIEAVTRRQPEKIQRTEKS